MLGTVAKRDYCNSAATVMATCTDVLSGWVTLIRRLSTVDFVSKPFGTSGRAVGERSVSNRGLSPESASKRDRFRQRRNLSDDAAPCESPPAGSEAVTMSTRRIARSTSANSMTNAEITPPTSHPRRTDDHG